MVTSNRTAGSWGLYLLVRFEQVTINASSAVGSWGLYLLVRFEPIF